MLDLIVENIGMQIFKNGKQKETKKKPKSKLFFRKFNLINF